MEKYIKCINCNELVSTNAKFCSNCGRKLKVQISDEKLKPIQKEDVLSVENEMSLSVNYEDNNSLLDTSNPDLDDVDNDDSFSDDEIIMEEDIDYDDDDDEESEDEENEDNDRDNDNRDDLIDEDNSPVSSNITSDEDDEDDEDDFDFDDDEDDDIKATIINTPKQSTPKKEKNITKTKSSKGSTTVYNANHDHYYDDVLPDLLDEINHFPFESILKIAVGVIMLASVIVYCIYYVNI